MSIKFSSGKITHTRRFTKVTVNNEHMLRKQQGRNSMAHKVCTESRLGSHVFALQGFVDIAPGYTSTKQLIDLIEHAV